MQAKIDEVTKLDAAIRGLLRGLGLPLTKGNLLDVMERVEVGFPPHVGECLASLNRMPDRGTLVAELRRVLGVRSDDDLPVAEELEC